MASRLRPSVPRARSRGQSFPAAVWFSTLDRRSVHPPDDSVNAVQCPTCNTSVPGHSKYCLSCGSQVSEPSMAGTVANAPEPHPLLELLRTELTPEYAVEREVGRGGMAVVFLANEVQLGRAVAIKVLPPEMALAPNVAERFKREARMAASLDHPNIIPVYRVGQAGGVHFMVQKFIEGRSLEAIIASQ